jgi:hypothetical protein
MDVDLPIHINFDLSSKKWRENKCKIHNSHIDTFWKYYDNRHKKYITRPMTYIAHTPRCSRINPETGQKCHNKSYFTKQQRASAELSIYIEMMDVDVLDGIYCWLHKKYEVADTLVYKEATRSAKLNASKLIL